MLTTPSQYATTAGNSSKMATARKQQQQALLIVPPVSLAGIPKPIDEDSTSLVNYPGLANSGAENNCFLNAVIQVRDISLFL